MLQHKVVLREQTPLLNKPFFIPVKALFSNPHFHRIWCTMDLSLFVFDMGRRLHTKEK